MSFEKTENITLNLNPNSKCPDLCKNKYGNTTEGSREGHSEAIKEHLEAQNDPSKAC